MSLTRNLCLAIVLMLSALTVFSQGDNVIEPSEVTRMMDAYIQFNRENQTVKGWRIQILATTERRLMERTRAKFKIVYPEYDLEFEHRNPFYLLKTGAYLNRSDALPMMRKFQEEFPGAFLVNEDIELESVLDNPY